MNRQQAYCLVAGSLLLIFGILGFAFRSGFNIADKYLFFSLILGGWGIYSAFN